MRRLAVVVFSLAALGCGSHTTLPQFHAQIFQKKLNSSGLQVIHINPINGQPAWPEQLVVDGNHKVWVTATTATSNPQGELIKILMNGEQRPYPLSFSPNGMVYGPDGDMWVTGSNLIASVDPNGVETDHPVQLPTKGFLQSIVVGPDGAFWFDYYTFSTSGGIGRMDESGFYTLYPTNFEPYSFVSGPDGNLWADDWSNVYVFDVLGNLIHTYPMNVPNQRVGDMTFGSDDALYLTSESGQGYALLRIGLDGSVTTFYTGNIEVLDITNGPDGTLWMTNPKSKKAALLNFDTKTQQFGQTVSDLGGHYYGLISGPDGNLWMSDGQDQKVAAYVIQKMSVSPNTFTLSVGKHGSFLATETNFSGPWTAVAADTTVVSVNAQSQDGNFTITALKMGKTNVVVYDTMFNSIAVKVTVQ